MMSESIKIPKLQYIVGSDELRPVMTYVSVGRDYTVATNANVLVYIKTNLIFNEEFIEKIPVQGMYLSKEDWIVVNRLQQDENCKWETESIFTVPTKKGEVCIKIKDTVDIGDYPNWLAVIPKDPEPIAFFSLNLRQLRKIVLAVGDGNYKTELSLYGSNKAVLLQPSPEIELEHYGALIMPVAKDQKP